MTTNLGKEKERLAQGEFLEKIKRADSPAEMVPVYMSERTENRSLCIYSALLPNVSIERSLKDPSWDLSIGDGLPGAVVYYENDEKKVDYLRFGNNYGIEPLVIYRSFHGIREDYWEINEEFRTFHALYHDRKQDQYIKIDDAGNEHVVAIVSPGKIQIRLLEIKQGAKLGVHF